MEGVIVGAKKLGSTIATWQLRRLIASPQHAHDVSNSECIRVKSMV
jgi:hypothetical protein